jgi:hypothetical protein
MTATHRQYGSAVANRKIARQVGGLDVRARKKTATPGEYGLHRQGVFQ